MTDQPAPAWYPDPTDPTLQRYWDGRQWTASTAPAPVATPPPPAQTLPPPPLVPGGYHQATASSLAGRQANVSLTKNFKRGILQYDGTYLHLMVKSSRAVIVDAGIIVALGCIVLLLTSWVAELRGDPSEAGYIYLIPSVMVWIAIFASGITRLVQAGNAVAVTLTSATWTRNGAKVGKPWFRALVNDEDGQSFELSVEGMQCALVRDLVSTLPVGAAHYGR